MERTKHQPDEIVPVPEHNPETCTTPGHIVIRDSEGVLHCGIGGYWSDDGIGIVHRFNNGAPVGHVRGELIRVNPPYSIKIADLGQLIDPFKP